MKKKVLILTYYFDPEIFRINDVAYDLASRGHDVTVITGIPNYPSGKFFDGYGLFSRRREFKNGVRIIRLPLIPRGSAHIFNLVLNYISFLFTSCIFVFFHSFFHKYDCIFVHGCSPVFIAIPGIIVKKIQKIPLYFWVLDLWPESMYGSSGYSNKKVINSVCEIVKWIYSNCDKILVSSKGFSKSICSKGDFKNKIGYLPNWAEYCFENPEMQIVEQLPKGFNIVYAGNIGTGQNFDMVFKAIECVNDVSINWILIGNGQSKAELQSIVKEKKLQNVFFLGQKPINSIFSYLRQCDVALLPLISGVIYSLTVPAKLQVYMACSMPVLGIVDGEAADIIKSSHCGLACNANDYHELAEIAKNMSAMNASQLNQMGDAGHNYYLLNFKRSNILDKVNSMICSI